MPEAGEVVERLRKYAGQTGGGGFLGSAIPNYLSGPLSEAADKIEEQRDSIDRFVAQLDGETERANLAEARALSAEGRVEALEAALNWVRDFTLESAPEEEALLLVVNAALAPQEDKECGDCGGSGSESLYDETPGRSGIYPCETCNGSGFNPGERS